MYDYDFDPSDRPCVYPNESYSKNLYSVNKSYTNIYGSE
jgi:hypothetical protein